MSAYRKFVDILQSEPRIPTPPKPPKAPKANPSEPVCLPVLGGLGTLGAPPIENEISLHAATPPPVPFSARAILGDFKDEGGANGEHGSRDVIAVWTDARNGRGSGSPTTVQPGRNPICEQSDVFFKFYNGQNGGQGSRGRESDSISGFLVAPCGGDMQDHGN